jgi:hypothetical protein
MYIPTVSDFLVVAANEIGYREGRDPDGNWNNLTKYGQWYGMNGQPWCAMFVSWVANKIGALDVTGQAALVPKYASCYAGLKWFRAHNQSGYWPPQAGDIFIMCEYNPGSTFDTGNGWATIHTGIVEKYLGDGKVQTIEGNTNTDGSAQGNGVYRLVRQDSQSSNQFIYCRPKWAPAVVVPPLGSGGASAPPPKPQPAPAPAPAPKPIAGSTYTGSKVIDVSVVRPNARNEASRRFNGLMWSWLCKNSPAYARANDAAWMKEPANLYGLQSQRATQEMYRILNARDPKKFGRVSLPTWPGPDGVRAIGGTPV